MTLSRRIRSSGVVLATLFAAALAQGQGFDPGCPLPFAEIQEEHPIDQTCGREGQTASEKHRTQNRAKNNFCAPGSPTKVTFFSFEVLQRKSDQALQDAGISGLPADRTILENIHTTSGGVKIGEGKLVRMKAFIVRAYLAGKETVNCKESGPQAADIHIVLGDSLDDEGCETLTAEISPHFRPDEWTSEKLESVDVPVRITGGTVRVHR